jgi:inosose dehydratase
MHRREFLLAGVTTAFVGAQWRGRLLPPGLSRTARLRFGCAAITWGGNDAEAITDIGALGYRGIQLRANAVTTWASRPDELRALLAEHHLTFVALSSGNISLDPSTVDATRELHLANARFLKATGGKYLQIIDSRPSGRTLEAADYRRMGMLLTEIGRRTADLGIPLGYHNHMGALGQSPDEVARVLDAADPRFVKLELDIAHYHQAGGDPADAIRSYGDRLLFLHLKDVESPVPGGKAGSYRFVPLGDGSVNLKAVFAALDTVSFDGWGIVELDGVAGQDYSAKEGNAKSVGFLKSLGYSVASVPDDGNR